MTPYATSARDYGATISSTYAGIASHPDSSTSDPEDTFSGGGEPVGSSTREKGLMDAGDGAGGVEVPTYVELVM